MNKGIFYRDERYGIGVVRMGILPGGNDENDFPWV